MVQEVQGTYKSNIMFFFLRRFGEFICGYRFVNEIFYMIIEFYVFSFYEFKNDLNTIQ